MNFPLGPGYAWDLSGKWGAKVESGIQELATADLAAEEVGRASRHSAPLGTPCANCQTPVQGAWCHACGQKAETYHRSILHLTGEAFEGLTHVDGRVWTTIRRLITSPAQLTRAYLDGKRASQIPPFRLYLVVLLILFMSGSVSAWLNPNDGSRFIGAPKPGEVHFETKLDNGKAGSAISEWLEHRVVAAAREPEKLVSAMEHWSHQFAILFVLVAAPLLTLAFVFQRQFYVFDHLIFSMHSLSFQGLLMSVVILAGAWFSGSAWLLLLAPVHLFAHMRGVYQTSIFGTLARMAFLFIGSCFGFAIMMAALVLVGLAQLH